MKVLTVSLVLSTRDDLCSLKKNSLVVGLHVVLGSRGRRRDMRRSTVDRG